MYIFVGRVGFYTATDVILNGIGSVVCGNFRQVSREGRGKGSRGRGPGFPIFPLWFPFPPCSFPKAEFSKRDAVCQVMCFPFDICKNAFERYSVGDVNPLN